MIAFIRRIETKYLEVLGATMVILDSLKIGSKRIVASDHPNTAGRKGRCLFTGLADKYPESR
jgi:hypothetical protein